MSNCRPSVQAQPAATLARATALGEHLAVTPPALVADPLGYSYQVAFLHAEAAGDAWSCGQNPE